MAEMPEMAAVVLVWSPAPGEVRELPIAISASTRVADVLAEHGTALGASAACACGIWGRVVPPEQVLQAGDRLELYRPLTVDPKVARRQRFARQGARTTGLFSRQRPGSKAGY